jgi:hypothetical protein
VSKRFLVGVQEVPGSNPGGPTKTLKDLQTPVAPKNPLPRPTGVQSSSIPNGH